MMAIYIVEAKSTHKVTKKANINFPFTAKMLCVFISQVEPHYGTEYQMEKIPPTTLNSWRKNTTNDELKLPRQNTLLDKDPTLLQIEAKPLPVLFLMMERIRMRAWYMPASSETFKIPKSFLFIKFSHSKKTNFTARESAINR